jgi:hypothetical protein
LNFNNNYPIRVGEGSCGRVVTRRYHNGIYGNQAKARVNLDWSQAWIYWHRDGRTRHCDDGQGRLWGLLESYQDTRMATEPGAPQSLAHMIEGGCQLSISKRLA